MPPCCKTSIFRPTTAIVQNGFTDIVGTTHVSATVANPSFTVAGPTKGIRFRTPDFGGPAIAGGDGAVTLSISTTQTGPITPAGWTPAIPAFPASAAGPFTKTQAGIALTLNADGRLVQQFGGQFRLAVQNANPPSPDFQWFTLEFSQTVTNIVVAGGFFNGSAASQAINLGEGVSQLQTRDHEFCACCPNLINPKCYTLEEVQVAFSSVTIESNPNSIPTQNLNLTIDQSLAGSPLKGVGPPAFLPPTNLVLSYNFPGPQQNISRIQLYNNDGGDLTDNDGIATVVFDLMDPGSNVLRTVNLSGNGGASGAIPSTISFLPTDNVARIRMRNITGLGNVANGPLWRELQAFQQVLQPTFAQVCFDGHRWFDPYTGDEVDPANILNCPDPFPANLPNNQQPSLTNFKILGSSFGIFVAQQDQLCNFVPVPNGANPFSGGSYVGSCFDPANASPIITWNVASGPSIEFEFGPVGFPAEQVAITFNDGGFPILFPFTATPMLVGESRLSTPAVGNSVVGAIYKLTYLAGPNGGPEAPHITSALQAHQWLMGPASNVVTAAPYPIKLRIERIA